MKWTDNEIEASIEQLLHDGKLEEISPDQYRPTEKFYREDQQP